MLSDVSFSGNHSDGSGGAIYGSGTITVTNSTFSGNTASGGGGEIGGGYGGTTVSVTNSTFSSNTAGVYGGAIYADGAVIATNSLFSNNTAGSNGGAIYASSSSTLNIIANNTYSGNAVVGSGAAIYIFSTSSIINSVFYGHAKPAIYATSAYNLYNNMIDTSTGIAGSTPLMAGNVVPGATSPFVDAANGNFRLAVGSLAINAGLDPNSTTFANLTNLVGVSNSVADIRQLLLTDLQGNPRPTPGTAVDIGAYEFLPMPVFISQSDCLFNWAERTYASLFAPAGAMSNTLVPYYYRYYPQTNAYLGTSSADNHVYYLGPLSNNSLFDVGALSPWLSTAGCQ